MSTHGERERERERINLRFEKVGRGDIFCFTKERKGDILHRFTCSGEIKKKKKKKGEFTDPKAKTYLSECFCHSCSMYAMWGRCKYKSTK